MLHDKKTVVPSGRCSTKNRITTRRNHPRQAEVVDRNVMHLTFRPLRPEHQNIDDIRFPRWLEIAFGVIVGMLAVICGACAAILLVLPFWVREINIGRLLAFFAGGAILIGAGIFLLKASIRLLSGQKQKAGYSSPRALRRTSYVFLFAACFILICLSPGNPTLIIPALVYGGVSLSLLKMASRRENLEHNQSTDPTP